MEYVVIRGIASVLHGVPRATFDLDILVHAEKENVSQLLQVLLEADLVTASLITPEELLSNEITVFNDRIRIDVQTSTPGLTFDVAWNSRVIMSYQGQDFYVVSREHLIASKRAADRPVDRDDVRMLENLRDRNEL